MEKLQEDLLGEGIINSGVEKRTIYMKEQFLSSETYQKGFVLINCQIYRKKTTDEEIDTTFNKIIKASNYNLHSTGISDKDQNRYTASLATDIIRIDENSFSEVVIRKALMAAENDFFRFENIKKHIVGLDSIDTLIKEYLPRFEIKYPQPATVRTSEANFCQKCDSAPQYKHHRAPQSTRGRRSRIQILPQWHHSRCHPPRGCR